MFLRTLNEFFKIDFQMDLLRKVFCFKIKEINLKTIKHKKQDTKQDKRKQNHDVKIFCNQANQYGESRLNHHGFPMALSKITRYQSRTNH